MSSRQSNVPVIFAAFVLVLASAPFVINVLGNPLLPPELAETVTAFAPTADAFRTKKAFEEYNRPSVILTLPPDDLYDQEASQGVDSSARLLTPTIPPPRIVTVTPLPPVEKNMLITERDAEQTIALDIAEINKPRVKFTAPDQILISGVVERPTLFGSITGNLIITGRLEQRGTQIYISVTSVTLNGEDVSRTQQGRDIEPMVNNWVRRRYFLNREVLSFNINSDGLAMRAREYSTVRLPTVRPDSTLAPTAFPTVALAATLTLTQTTPKLSDPTGTHVVRRVITDEEATALARSHLAFVSNPRVRFMPEGMEITGQIPISLNPLSPEANLPFRLMAALDIQGSQVRVVPIVLEIGIRVDNAPVGQRILDELQTWVQDKLVPIFVVRLKLQSGSLVIN